MTNVLQIVKHIGPAAWLSQAIVARRPLAFATTTMLLVVLCNVVISSVLPYLFAGRLQAARAYSHAPQRLQINGELRDVRVDLPIVLLGQPADQFDISEESRRNARLDNVESGSKTNELPVVAYAVGWPFRSWYFYQYATQTEESVDGELYVAVHLDQLAVRGAVSLIHKPGSKLLLDDLVLPVKPIVYGLLANSALYAVCIAVFDLIAAYIKTARRLARGVCVSCKYPRHVGSMLCPECGTQHLSCSETSSVASQCLAPPPGSSV